MRRPLPGTKSIEILSRSLSLRLLCIFLFTGIAALVLVSVLFSRGLGSQFQRNIQPHLALYARYLQQDLGSPPSPARAQALAEDLPIRITLLRNGRVAYSTGPRAIDARAIEFRPVREPPTSRLTSLTPVQIGFDRQRRNSVIKMTSGADTVYLELLRGRGHDRHGSLVLRALAALLGVLLASYLAIRHQLRPIARIQQGVQRMANGELQERIGLPGQGDLASLAGSVDAMATRIQAMLDAKRQLLLAISHELRSPLARARVAVELMEASTNQDRLRADLDDMQRMISDIMESERLQQHAVLNVAPVNLNELIDRVVAAIDSDIEVSTPAQPVIIAGDATRLKILLRNLISNALHHGRAALSPNAVESGTAIEVVLEHTPTHVRVLVIDHGPGIAAEHRSAVTEPFFRPDTARTRHAGGVGLGLTLVRLIAEAHHGSLQINSRTAADPIPDPDDSPGCEHISQSGTGTRITIVLPREQPFRHSDSEPREHRQPRLVRTDSGSTDS